MSEQIVIPDKPAFKAGEVCELLKVPPYVLKSWENEFRDLGVSKTVGGPRVYRREDVARAVRIRHLVLNEGLTLAGVRRRLDQESGAESPEDALLAEIVAAAPAGRPAVVSSAVVAPAAPPEWRARMAGVRDGLRDILDVLSRPVARRDAGVVAAGAPAASVPPAAAPRRRAAASTSRRAIEPAQASPPEEPAPPPRELVVEPDPVEPSLFADAEGTEPVDSARRQPRGRGKGPARAEDSSDLAS